MRNEEFVRTMSREGKASELLRGTLFYALVMVFSTIFFWYVPVDGTLAPNFTIFIPGAFLIFGPLAGGDGFADLIGRRYGKHKFKVFAEKNIEGSIAMFVFSLLFTFGLLFIYWIAVDLVWASINVTTLVLPTFIVSIVSTIIEIISPPHWDNLLIPIIVTLSIFILGWLGVYTYPIWHIGPLL